MRKIVAGKLQTGADFEGSRGDCICSGTIAVKNSHYAGPAYCVGYCGNNGIVTRNANANLAKTKQQEVLDYEISRNKNNKNRNRL